MRAFPLLLLLAACQADPAPAPVPTPTPPGHSAFQAGILALSEAERNIVFIRAIRDAGHDCQGVVGSTARRDVAGGALFYVARCSDGASYGVLLARDGTAQVVAA